MLRSGLAVAALGAVGAAAGCTATSPASSGPSATGSPMPSAPPSGPSPVLSGARSALLGGDAGDVRLGPAGPRKDTVIVRPG
jgi:hypothetical protein